MRVRLVVLMTLAALARAWAEPPAVDATKIKPLLRGYTDGKGGETYNQSLSERRADAVKQFLKDKYGIDASKLVSVGYGKTQLKNSSDPFAAEKRLGEIPLRRLGRRHIQ